jgi:hypothetical protein
MSEQGRIFRGRRGIAGRPVRWGLLEVKSELCALRPDALEQRLDKLELFRELLVALENLGDLLACPSEFGFQRIEFVGAAGDLIGRLVAHSAGAVEFALQGVDPGAVDLGLLLEPALCDRELSMQVLLTVECGGVQKRVLACGVFLRRAELLPPARDELLALDLPETKGLLVLAGMLDAGRLVAGLVPFVLPPNVLQPGLERLHFGSGGLEVSGGLVAFGTDSAQLFGRLLQVLDLGDAVDELGPEHLEGGDQTAVLFAGRLERGALGFRALGLLPQFCNLTLEPLDLSPRVADFRLSAIGA